MTHTCNRYVSIAMYAAPQRVSSRIWGCVSFCKLRLVLTVGCARMRGILCLITMLAIGCVRCYDTFMALVTLLCCRLWCRSIKWWQQLIFKVISSSIIVNSSNNTLLLLLYVALLVHCLDYMYVCQYYCHLQQQWREGLLSQGGADAA